MYREHEFILQPEPLRFSDAGIIPGDGSWLTPTDAFMELWEQASEQLTKQGFRLRHDGTSIGAPHDHIVYWRKTDETYT